MGCESPPPEPASKAAYQCVMCAICNEVVCLILSIVGLGFAMGFPGLRSAAALSVCSGIIATATVSSYPCCCVVTGKRAFVGFLSSSLVFCFVAFVVACATAEETPCVRKECFQLTLSNQCTVCADKGKDDCDPDLCYECAHTIGDIFGDVSKCDNVHWCSNWDPDCSKSGNEDDHWFYGFETQDDCEEFNGVPFLRSAALGMVVAASLLSGLLRCLCIHLVHKAPTQDPAQIGVAQNVRALNNVPIVPAVEMAPTAGAAPEPVSATATLVPAVSATMEGHPALPPPDDAQGPGGGALPAKMV